MSRWQGLGQRLETVQLGVFVTIVMGLLVVIGIALGLNSPIQFSLRYARYSGLVLLATLDSLIGGSIAKLEGSWDFRLFATGLLFNSVMAGILAFVGDVLGLELYFAAIVALGIRIFNNLASLRRQLLGARPRLPAT
jgi:small basic protein